jgi:hypothetical protein
MLLKVLYLQYINKYTILNFVITLHSSYMFRRMYVNVRELSVMSAELY